MKKNCRTKPFLLLLGALIALLPSGAQAACCLLTFGFDEQEFNVTTRATLKCPSNIPYARGLTSCHTVPVGTGPPSYEPCFVDKNSSPNTYGVLAEGTSVPFNFETKVINGVCCDTSVSRGSGGPLPPMCIPEGTNQVEFRPVKPCANTPINSNTELRNAVRNYIASGGESNPNSLTSTTYGHPIGTWCIGSGVDSFQYLFYDQATFNEDISQWDTSGITNMAAMFQDANAFNQPLNSWDTSRVTDMNFMFEAALAFNQPLNGWDTSRVTNFYWMFLGARSFDQELGDWDTASVTDMSYMFLAAREFNQPLSGWDTSSVADMREMFFGAKAFDQELGDWDTSSVTDMSFMFSEASAFNQPLGDWNLSSVSEGISKMFYGAKAFNQDLCSWGFYLKSKPVDVSLMFLDTSCESQDDPDQDLTPVQPLCKATCP